MYNISYECWKAFQAAITICQPSQQMLVAMVSTTPLSLRAQPSEEYCTMSTTVPESAKAIKDHRPYCPPWTVCWASFFRRPWDGLSNTAATVFWDLHSLTTQLYCPSSCFQTLVSAEGTFFSVKLTSLCVCVCVCIKVYKQQAGTFTVLFSKYLKCSLCARICSKRLELFFICSSFNTLRQMLLPPF